MVDYIYDLETFPNVFLMAVSQVGTDNRWMFEISDWKNDTHELFEFMVMLKNSSARMVGFNNINFDYPILHQLLQTPEPTAHNLYNKAMSIINSNDRFSHIIGDRDRYVEQVDLFTINHFDNLARSTSLKLLEFNMRRPRIEDLPFPPGTVLTEEQTQVLVDYNWEDIYATMDFYYESLPAIEFREELTETYGRNFINDNDTKVGKQFFIMELEKHRPGSCYEYIQDETFGPDGKLVPDGPRRRVPKQTVRGAIPLSEVVFPYIQFQHPEFQRVHQWFLQATVHDANDLTAISATINDFQFDFGKGGIHGSIRDSIVVAEPDVAIIDLDVTSYYPSLAIVNRLAPEHLGDAFCDIYAQIKAQRAQHEKGTAANKMLKLALNGVYGDTGNAYSPFYDMKYLLSITINGQLLLCMLAEHVMKIPGALLVQCNTDGLTVKLPRHRLPHLRAIADWWQEFTKLDLEEVEYSRMFIRDVNNYIGEYTDGKLKRKGAYENLPPAKRNPTGWHQNLSALVVPLAAEAFLTKGTPVRSFVMHHPDIMDFMLRTKVKRIDKVEIDDVECQRITRYLVTKTGGAIVKVSPPPAGYIVGQWKRANSITDQTYNAVRLEVQDVFPNPDTHDTTGCMWDERINTKNQSKYEMRRTGIDVGWLVTEYNIMRPIDRSTINYEYYIQETHKLVDQLKVVV